MQRSTSQELEHPGPSGLGPCAGAHFSLAGRGVLSLQGLAPPYTFLVHEHTGPATGSISPAVLHPARSSPLLKLSTAYQER